MDAWSAGGNHVWVGALSFVVVCGVIGWELGCCGLVLLRRCWLAHVMRRFSRLQQGVEAWRIVYCKDSPSWCTARRNGSFWTNAMVLSLGSQNFWASPKVKG
jgi:hypothetical protein